MNQWEFFFDMDQYTFKFQGQSNLYFTPKNAYYKEHNA